MVVDFILSATFEEIDLDEMPCIFPSCGHILTVESMDGHMSMSEFYINDGEGKIIELKNSSEPFSASKMKNCPSCRGPLRNLNRYSRIVRRALIDESTKKFILWANAGFIPLVTEMQEIEAELRESIKQDHHHIEAESGTTSAEPIRLRKTRDEQISNIRLLVKKGNRYKPILELRRKIKQFLQQVDETEQPFGRIYDLVQDARRHRGINIELQSNNEILQVRSRLLTTVLLIRCDYTLLLMFLNNHKAKTVPTAPTIQVDLSRNRDDCEKLIEESNLRDQRANVVEGHLYWARFLALERGFVEHGSEIDALLDEAKSHLQQARVICAGYPGQTAGMENEVKEVENMLRDSTFYMPVSNEEKAAVYAAMAREFRGTGHWYYCVNGHPFTIGECGMPMQEAKCPQCGAQIGGLDHRPVSGVNPARDFELQFERLGINE
ncbi:Adenosinetriphosphatase/Nucleoside-triphosphate phosphatase, partial [Scytalidium lignicola]